MAEVVPTGASAAIDERFVYIIRESHALPQIDCFRALKHVLMSGRLLQICNRYISRYKRWLSLFLLIGIIQSMVVPYLPAKLGRVAGFVGLVEIPVLAVALISLRYDMIRLLLRTYEFWYLTCLNLAFFVCAFVSYRDMRSISLVPGALGFQLLPLQDANFRALTFTIKVFFVAAVAHAGLVVYLNLRLVDQWTTVQVFQYGKYSITADNVVSNYLAITTAMLLRNAYRKHRWVRDSNGGKTTVVRCIAYRCRVHLRLQNMAEVSSIHLPLDERKAQMRLVPSDQVYDSNQIVLQSLLCASRTRRFFAISRAKRLGLHLIGLIGLTLTSTSLTYESKYLTKRPILYISSALLTGGFCGVVVSLYQRQLLLKLIVSFDFVFLLTNITAIHVCISEPIVWTPKCFALVSSWMWIMWAITMDALTPDMRRALGLRRQHLIGVVLAFEGIVILLAVKFIFLKSWSLEDRSILQVTMLGKTIEVRVVQLFFSCLFSSFPMCLRILWRLQTAKHGELILIQGAVEYEDILLAQRRQPRNNRWARGSEEAQQTQRPKTNYPVFSWLVRPTKVHPTGPATSLFQVQSG